MTFVLSKDGVDHLRRALTFRPNTASSRALGGILDELSNLVGDDNADKSASDYEAKVAERLVAAKPKSASLVGDDNADKSASDYEAKVAERLAEPKSAS